MTKLMLRILEALSTLIWDAFRIGQKYSIVQQAVEQVSEQANESAQWSASGGSSAEQASK